MRRALVLATIVAIASPGGVWARAERDTTAKPPAKHEISFVYDVLDHSLVRPATRFFDAALLARRISGRPREAANVDERDQVRLPSTWWQPRLGFRTVTVEQMLRGPGPGTGPAPGKWTVTSAKLEGVTPGFQIKDANGDRFLIKFDPRGHAELASGAAVIGSRLFWAAGYNVPDDALGWFRPEDLVIADDATYSDLHGKKVPMRRQFIDDILARVERQPDGRYRCITSRYLEGKPIGPYEYRGRRTDDPEDLVPHELRRELRGLWAVCAWLNHADSRAPNTLDTWVTENGHSFVRHHLIDFSAILGAGPVGPRSLVTGTEYYVDYGVMARQAVTAGLAPFAWERARDPGIPAVGVIEFKTFDPVGWRPDYPNPAFDERTARDVRWGVRIVSGFTDAHIRAAVAAAHYSDSRAADYVTRILTERRDVLVHRWLGADAGRLRASE